MKLGTWIQEDGMVLYEIMAADAACLSEQNQSFERVFNRIMRRIEKEARVGGMKIPLSRLEYNVCYDRLSELDYTIDEDIYGGHTLSW